MIAAVSADPALLLFAAIWLLPTLLIYADASHNRAGWTAWREQATPGWWITNAVLFGWLAGIYYIYKRAQVLHTTCPDCAETVQASARICKHCGHTFVARND